MRHIHGNTVVAEIDCPCQLMDFILRDFGDSCLTGELFPGNQALILFDYIGNTQVNGIVFLSAVGALHFKALPGFGITVSVTMATAVLSKTVLDIFLILCSRMRVAKMGIQGQLAFIRITEKIAVDLILGDEHLTLPKEVWLCCKTTFGILHTVQHTFDSVLAIGCNAVPHDFTVTFIRRLKLFIFLGKCDEELIVPRFFCKGVGAIRKYTMFIVNGKGLCKHSHFPALFGQVTRSQDQSIRHIR